MHATGSRDVRVVPLVEATFAPRGNGNIAFDLGPYDRERPLIIDPEVATPTYVGGPNLDEGLVRACLDDDQQDFLVFISIVGGDDVNDTFESVVNAFHHDPPSLDAEVQSIPASTLVVGGSGNDRINDVAVTEQGQVVATGGTTSADFAGVPDGHAPYAGDGISPQEILSEFGSLVSPETGVGLMFDQDGNVLREIGGTQALVNGEAMPMVLASQFQSSFIAPGDLLSGKGVGGQSATVQFVVDGDPSNTITIPVVPANPGLYSLDASGTGQGTILNPDFSVNGPGSPAPSDGFISVFGTGGGAVDPPCPDGGVGSSAEPLPRLQLPVSAVVNGEEAQVLFAGSAPQLVCGANQIVIAPADNPTGPAVTVQVCVAGACRNVVTAAFE